MDWGSTGGLGVYRDTGLQVDWRSTGGLGVYRTTGLQVDWWSTDGLGVYRSTGRLVLEVYRSTSRGLQVNGPVDHVEEEEGEGEEGACVEVHPLGGRGDDGLWGRGSPVGLGVALGPGEQLHRLPVAVEV